MSSPFEAWASEFHRDGYVMCRGLLPRERWLWFERLWSDVCALRVRYRLAVR